MEHFRNKAEQMKEAGWGPADIRNAITQEIRQSPEYHEKHRGWEGKVPLINQLAPGGNDGSYFNAQANCGPTSMAMVARAVGYGSHLTDAQLIMDMYNKCGTQGGNGTPVDGIRQGANAIGLDATTYHSSAGVEKMAEEIRNGKMVVANGEPQRRLLHRDGPSLAHGAGLSFCLIRALRNGPVRSPHVVPVASRRKPRPGSSTPTPRGARRSE
jgi:hypothetical protein